MEWRGNRQSPPTVNYLAVAIRMRVALREQGSNAVMVLNPVQESFFFWKGSIWIL